MQNKYLEKALLLEKLAATEPKEHTKRVLKKLDKTDSLIVAHSMGSGKTLTALLAAQKNLKAHKEEHVTMVVPASLVTNVYSQAKEHGVELDPERFHVVSYEKAIRDPELASRKHSLVILDEAHKIRNEGTQRSDILKPILKASRKTMFLTGTPSYNKPLAAHL